MSGGRYERLYEELAQAHPEDQVVGPSLNGFAKAVLMDVDTYDR